MSYILWHLQKHLPLNPAGGNHLSQVIALLSVSFTDGANTYAYPSASFASSGPDSGQANGFSDRLQQTYNGATTTNYTIDMAGGLTQVLSDGTNTYLYGEGRIAQKHNSITEYYLDDALGSVRQLTDTSGEVVLARVYDPFGSLVEQFHYLIQIVNFLDKTNTSPNDFLYHQGLCFSQYLNNHELQIAL